MSHIRKAASKLFDTLPPKPLAYILVKEFTRLRVSEVLPARASQTLGGTLTRFDRLHLFAGIFAIGLTAYLAIEPTESWLLLLLCGVTAIGSDNIVRSHPKAQFHRLDDTALFLFVPVLFMLAAGLFFEEVASGQWTIAAGPLSIIPFWLIVRAEYESVDRTSPAYHWHRLVLNAATYVVAFLLFSTMYEFDLSLLTTAFAAGLVSLLLGIEVLREEAMDTARTITYALAIGVLLAEAAWAAHFLPFDRTGAAVFMLLAFYLMSGLVHHYLADRLTTRTTAEFTFVALTGMVVIGVFSLIR